MGTQKARTGVRALLVLLEYAPWDSNPEPAD